MIYVWQVGLILWLSVVGMAAPLEERVEQAVLAHTSGTWQILEILSKDEMDVKDRFKELKPHIQNGIIQQAVILDAKEDKIPTLYRLLLKDNKVTALKTQLSPNKSMEQTITLAFNQLTDGNSLRTGIFISAHGNGNRMLYQDKALTVKYILQQAQRKNLNIEVLELDACNMGNLLSATDIANYKGRVHYFLGASSLMCGNFIIPNPSFAAYLPDAKTALKKVLQVRLEQFSKWGFSYTNNLFVVDMPQVNLPLRAWVESFKRLKQQQPKLATKLIGFESKSLEDPNWYSLTELLKWQIAQTEQETGFANRTKQLLNALDNALVEQWCYSKPQNKVFKDKYISPQSGCLNGFATSKEYIEKVLK